jgi:hypothetical protein
VSHKVNRIDIAGHVAIFLQLTRGLRFGEVDHSGIIAQQDVTALGDSGHQD